MEVLRRILHAIFQDPVPTTYLQLHAQYRPRSSCAVLFLFLFLFLFLSLFLFSGAGEFVWVETGARVTTDYRIGRLGRPTLPAHPPTP
ncbi:hypothetical protein J1614_002930 [Plenodomus biglobosus]|nr:hypothetical protein J1614_002930 [Plenodomus biglobosus]